MRRSLVTLALFALSSGCHRAEPSTTTTAPSGSYTLPSVPPGHHVVRYASRGVVKGIGEGKKSVKIDHEDIPNFMKAMTMSFPVTDPRLLDGIAVGDKVSFSFGYDEDDTRTWIESIKRD